MVEADGDCFLDMKMAIYAREKRLLSLIVLEKLKGDYENHYRCGWSR
jgi:hypothetical protein